jgi:hypothetical protein
MTTPLGQLLSDSWDMCRKNIRTLVIGALLFGTLVAVVGAVANRRIEGHIWQGMQRMGIEQNEMMELQRKIQSGEENAVQEAMMEMQRMGGKMDKMTDEEREAFFAKEGMMMMRGMLPVMGGGMLWWLFVALFSTSYYLLLALGKAKEPVDILNLSVKKVLPLFGVWTWSMLRSFIWIPILGIIPAIILGPRFALSSVLLIDKNMGVRASVASSHSRTRGYWGKIIGNTLAVGIVTVLASWVLNIATSPIAQASTVFGIWTHAVIQQFTMAYSVVFLVLLSKTVMEHPVK